MNRIATNPALALPMIKYSDHIAQLADPCRNYSSEQWLNYDRQFSLTISRNHATYLYGLNAMKMLLLNICQCPRRLPFFPTPLLACPRLKALPET